MGKAAIAPERPSNMCEKQTDMSLIERVIELIGPDELEEHQRVEIACDKCCRRDAAEIRHADRIHRHTLLDDNPASG